jgi:hypothetical protein
LLFLIAGQVAFAGWDFTPPGDPNRNWGASLTSGAEYDDNLYGTENNRQSGFRLNSDIKLRASIPLERFFMGAQYDYGITYPRDLHIGGIDQAHNLSVSANYAFSPRLTLALTESLVKSLQPGIVLGPANAPVTLQFAGTYFYDAVQGTLNYALTPRWILSVSGSWDTWQYQQATIATNNDHEDYSATVSALYALDTRTTVGLNYQYTQNVFSFPGTNDALNGISHTVYLSFVRRFNPRLSLQLNGGYTIQQSGSGAMTSAPSALGGLTYNYGPNSTISLNIAESLTEATVGITQEFSAQENTSFVLEINHQITTRLKATANAAYVLSTFKESVSTFSASGQEEQLSSSLVFTYAFRDWLAGVLGYSFTRIFPSNTSFVTPYSRDQVNVGMTLTY